MTWKERLLSWKTSVTGFILGAAFYVYTTGLQLPTNKQETFYFVCAVLVAGCGLALPDPKKKPV